MINKRNKGKLIVIEGGDYSGKSSLIKGLKKVLSSIYPEHFFMYTREPGNLLCSFNSKKCEEIREDLKINKRSQKEEIELFAESRYLHTLDMLEYLNNGVNIICDRYILSSLVYQSGYKKEDDYDILYENMDSLNLLWDNNIVLENIILNVSPFIYKDRKNKREKELKELNKDVMEEVEQHIIEERLERYKSINNRNNKIKEICMTNINSINTDYMKPSSVLIEALSIIDEIL